VIGLRWYIVQAIARVTPRYRTKVTDTWPPSVLPSRTIFLVIEDGYEELVSFACPCLCGATVHLNLIPDQNPFWCLSRNKDKRVTLYPSVRREKGCRSHFWVRNGRVQWCSDSEPQVHRQIWALILAGFGR